MALLIGSRCSSRRRSISRLILNERQKAQPGAERGAGDHPLRRRRCRRRPGRARIPRRDADATRRVAAPASTLTARQRGWPSDAETHAESRGTAGRALRDAGVHRQWRVRAALGARPRRDARARPRAAGSPGCCVSRSSSDDGSWLVGAAGRRRAAIPGCAAPARASRRCSSTCSCWRDCADRDAPRAAAARPDPRGGQRSAAAASRSACAPRGPERPAQRRSTRSTR